MTSPRSSMKSRPVLTIEDLAFGIRHDLFDDRLGQMLLRNHELGITDPVDEGMLLRRVTRERDLVTLGQRPPFLKPQLSRGELILSHDGGDDIVKIPIDWLVAGLLIAGNTGAGKTTLIEFLLLQIVAFANVWVTDMYKKRLRHLRPLLKRLGRDLIILSPPASAINPLQAAGDPRRFCSFISDLIARVIGLPPRARTILRTYIHALYERFGIFDDRTDCWPTLFDLYVTILNANDLNAAAKEALLDRLGALLASLGKCAAYRRAWSPVDLADHCIVFEMLGTGEQAKTLLLTYCLFALFLHDMEQQTSGAGDLRHLICFEDAQRFFYDAADTSAGDMPPFEELAGVTRESGRALCLAVQSMHGFPRGLAANLATKVMGRMGTNEDWLRMGADLGMGSEIGWAKLNLGPGHFIMQAPSGKWRHPFLATVPEMRVPQTVSDEEAEESVQALAHLPIERATEFDRWQPFASIAIDASTAHAPALEAGEKALLEAIISNPGRRSGDYIRLVGMGARRVVALRRQLVDRGLLREHEVAMSTTGRAAIVLEPLPRAYEALGLPQPNKGDS